jgi:hypothetical protein
LKSILRHLESHKKNNFDMNSHFIANMFCGFKSMNDSHPEVKSLVRWVTSATSLFTSQANAANRAVEWSSADFSTALYGLQQMGGSRVSNVSNTTRFDNKDDCKIVTSAPILSDEVLELLTQLNMSFLQSKTTFDTKHLGRAMYSLSNMHSEYKEVRNILSSLTSKVNAQRLVNGTKHRNTVPDSVIAKALYGFRSMSSDRVEVREMATLLGDVLRVEGRGDMNLQAVCMALYGMSSLSSAHEEVQGLLEVLHQRLLAASKREPLTGYSVGNVLMSLQMFRENGMSLSSNDGSISERELLIRQQILQTMLHSLKAKKSQHVHLGGLAVRGALRGLGRLSLDIPEVPLLLEALLHKAKRIDPRSAHGSTCNGAVYPTLHFTPEHAAGSLGAFQNVDSGHVVVKQWLEFLSETLREGIHTCPISVSYVVTGYKGLRQMNSQCDAVRKVLKALYITVNGFDNSRNSSKATQWTSLHVSLVINSLQNMSSFHAEVRNTLQALLIKSGSDEAVMTFSPDELSLSLYGMRDMTPMYAEVSDTLALLQSGITNYQQNSKSNMRVMFTARTVATCLNGLQNMSSSHQEVKSLLRTLADAIVHCCDAFRNQDLGSVYLGLQSMDCSDEEVIGVLRAVNDKAEKTTEQLNVRTVSDVLFGLQRCDIKHAEVTRALDWVYGNMTSSLAHDKASMGLNLEQISRSLFGLMCMVHKESFLQETHSSVLLLNTFLMETKHIVSSLNNEESVALTQKDILSLYRSLILLSHHSLRVLPFSSQEVLSELIRHVEPRVLSVTTDVGARESSTEKRFASVTKNLLAMEQGGDFDVSTSCILHGFSCDILIRPSAFSDEKTLCNIELDGPAHLLPRKKLMCDLRDSYFEKECGVRVVRVNLCNYPEHDDELITAILKSELGSYFSFPTAT